MRANHKAVLIFLVLCAAFVAGGYMNPTGKSDVWEVLIGTLPKEVHSRNASETPTFYILKQTHEPLFRRPDGQNYTSRILRSWKRDARSTEYTFCPDTSLSFDANTKFSLGFLFEHLTRLLAQYDNSARIRTQESCAVVTFSRPMPGFLEFIAQYENSPHINTDSKIEHGLGPFYVESLGKRIVLKRKDRVSNGYNKIIFHEYAGEKDPLLHSPQISDFNKLSSFQQPEWIRTKYAGLDNVELRVAAIAINSPDKRLRQAIYQCIDVEKFRKAFLPGKAGFLNISRVLPVGVPGGIPGLPAQNCSQAQKGYLEGKRIVLANLYNDNLASLKQFSDEFLEETGARFTVRNYVPADLVKELYDRSGRKSYDLIVIVSDTFRPDYKPFLEYYLGPDSAINHLPRQTEALYKKLLYEDNRDAKMTMAISLSEQIVEQALALPLYQGGQKLFYPRRIKNLEVGRGFSEYPEIADFRW